jgi:hypothetical protein
VLLITGLMGIPSLYTFNRALIVGGVGFFWIRYLICFLSMILSHCCKVFLNCIMVLYGGVFGDGVEIVLG